MHEKMGFTEDQLADFQEAFLLFHTKEDGRIPITVILCAQLLTFNLLHVQYCNAIESLSFYMNSVSLSKHFVKGTVVRDTSDISK